MPIENDSIEGESEISSSGVMESLVEYFRHYPGKMIHLFGSASPSVEVKAQRVPPAVRPSMENSSAPSPAAKPKDESGSQANYPDILLQAELIHLGDATNDGRLVAGVSVAWFEIIAQLA